MMLDLFLLIFGLYFLCLFASFFFSIPLMVIKSIGLYTMAKNANREDSIVAWIPGFNNLLIGELIEKPVGGFRDGKWILALAPFILLPMGIAFKGAFSGVAFILFVIYTVYYYLNLYQLYKTYAPEKADFYILASVFFPALKSVFIFLMRDNSRKEEKTESEFNFDRQRAQYQKNMARPSGFICVMKRPEPEDTLKEDTREIEEKIDEIELTLKPYLSRFKSDFKQEKRR